MNRSTEVEDILSGKVLDTDIPGLEELMSTESKYHFQNGDNLHSYSVTFNKFYLVIVFIIVFNVIH